jgi:hypothetical protein
MTQVSKFAVPGARPAVLMFAALLCAVLCLNPTALAQSGTLNTYPGLNTVQYRLNATAAPDPTIAVGTLEYCEHVNSGYQCWYKGGANANQPVSFFGSTNVKTDSQPWTQNSNNSGNTSHCGTAYTPNSQLLNDNVYNLWIMEKRITAASTGHNYMCVAISNVEDVGQTTPVSFNWFAFEYDLDNVIPQNSRGHFYYPDYPQSGLWQTSTSTTPPYTAASDQALWITYDLQDPDNNSNINGVLVCAVDLAGLRNSNYLPWTNNSKTPACVVAHPLATYNQRRSWVPANNTDTIPPLSGDGEMFTYMVEPPKDGRSYLTDPNHTQGVEQWTIDWTATTPTPAFVNSWDLGSTMAGGDQLGCFRANNYYDTVCIPQPSTSTTGVYIDSVADRMQQFFHYTSNGGTAATWTSAHDLQIHPSSSANTQTEADIRILEWNTAVPKAVYLANDYPITDPQDPNAFVFLPSVARDKVGNLQGILGLSGSGATEHPGLDSWYFLPGTLTSASYGYIENPANDGDAKGTDTLNYRWGDWQGAVLDPSDGCTVWVVGEYLPSNRTTTPYWYTEIGKLPPLDSCSTATVQLSPTSLSFGNQAVGTTSPSQKVTLNNQQSVALNITSIAASGDFFQTNNCGSSVPANGTCTINVSFTPSTTGTRTGTLTVTDNAASSPQTASLSGTGISSSISVSPPSLNFNNQVLNTTSAGSSVTVTNNGATNVTVNSLAISGNYSETDNCSGVTLVPNQSCTVTIKFTPTVLATVPGALTINDTAGGAPHLVSLTGTGIVPVAITSSLSFSTYTVGTTSPTQNVTVTNNQSTSVTLGWSTSGDYSVAAGGTTPCSTTLAGNSKCNLQVSFTPESNGNIKGALSVTYNVAGSPAITGLTGTGTGGPVATITFSPTTYNFPNTAVGGSATKSVTVKNIGSSSVNLTSFSGSGYFTVAPSGSKPCGATLAASATCTVTVTFAPVLTGSFTGSMTLANSSGNNPLVLNLTGVAVTPATLSPTSINFGNISVGTISGVQVVTVTNNTSTALPISSVTASGQFIYTSGGSIPCGASVPANSICTLGVEFSPAVSGPVSGALTFSFSGNSSPLVVGLSGTGI